MSELTDFIEAYAETTGEELYLADGFGDAILGVAEGTGRSPTVIYDYEKCVAILGERDGMEPDDAREFIDFNFASAYIGANTPIFLRRPTPAYSSEESDKRVKRLMEQVGMPNSQQLYLAFKQLENELSQLWLRP